MRRHHRGAEGCSSSSAGRPLIALTQIGFQQDLPLAERLPFLDLVIGGHSHTDLDAPQWVGEVPVLTARAFAYYAGVAEVEVGDAGARLVAWKKVPLRDDAPPVRTG